MEGERADEEIPLCTETNKTEEPPCVPLCLHTVKCLPFVQPHSLTASCTDVVGRDEARGISCFKLPHGTHPHGWLYCTPSPAPVQQQPSKMSPMMEDGFPSPQEGSFVLLQNTHRDSKDNLFFVHHVSSHVLLLSPFTPHPFCNSKFCSHYSKNSLD